MIMMNKSIEILANDVNCPIVKIEGRSFPGMIIQGDTMFSLYRAAEKVLKSSEANDGKCDYDAAEFLRDSLKEYISIYENVLESNGMELPYVKS